MCVLLLTRRGTAVYPEGQPSSDQSLATIRVGGSSGLGWAKHQLDPRPYPAFPRFSRAREAVHEAGRSHDRYQLDGWANSNIDLENGSSDRHSIHDTVSTDSRTQDPMPTNSKGL